MKSMYKENMCVKNRKDVKDKIIRILQKLFYWLLSMNSLTTLLFMLSIQVKNLHGSEN